MSIFRLSKCPSITWLQLRVGRISRHPLFTLQNRRNRRAFEQFKPMIHFGWPLLSLCAALRQGSEQMKLEAWTEMMEDEIFTPEEYEKMIANYTAEWKKHGVEVEVFANMNDLLSSEGQNLPWKTPLDKAVDLDDTEDRPRCKKRTPEECKEVKLEDVVPYLKDHPYLYHGGDITPNFANGVDFEKGKDQITGPAFFTTHNIYNALLYGSKGMLTWGQPVLDLEQHKKGIYWTDFYRLVMEIEVQKLKNCRGLVASMAFLKKAAEQGAEHGVEEFMETQCGGHKCSFVAVNWNEDGQLGSGSPLNPRGQQDSYGRSVPSHRDSIHQSNDWDGWNRQV
ncbi:unnamed protein product [Durusdinium trenchii]|uniref:Uncharacterized protein n=1 Tax=Durusdinium trenchii TaxID=1381693 RepID=A0ABP0JYX6_9DINO